MSTGRTPASSVPAQPPAPKLDRPPSMISPAPVLDGAGQQLVLGRREEVGGQVAEDVDVVPARGELVVVELAVPRPGRAADDPQVGLDVGRRGDRAHQELVLPGGVRPLEEEDVQAALQDRDERADLVVRRDQLPLLGLDPERDPLLAGRLRDVLQAGDRDDLGPLGDLDRWVATGPACPSTSISTSIGWFGEAPDATSVPLT